MKLTTGLSPRPTNDDPGRQIRACVSVARLTGQDEGLAAGKSVNESDIEPSQLTDEDQYSDRSDPPPKKAKRRRTNKVETKTPRKKHVRGKQGGLQGIMKMPLEIFTEIAYHIAPSDLIALIRTNKLFRAMLLQRSALPIWQRALSNVPKLPPCPTGMYEPQYAALMFSKCCTLCGAHAPADPDTWLRARLCPNCRDTKLIQVPWTFDSSILNYLYVAKSDVTKPKIKKLPGSSGVIQYCFREDLEKVAQRRAEFIRAGDTQGLKAWEEAARNQLEIRNKEGGLLWRYFYSTGLDRSNELHRVKWQRRDKIRERLKELGWEEEELEFHGEHAKPWKALVDVAKPLTEKIWTSILPKLVPLLEANRARIQEAERRKRQVERRNKLNSLLCDVKRETHPYRAILDALGIEIPPKYAMFAAPLELPNPFPESAVAMEWDFLKDLYEQEISIERVEELFNERRRQLEQEVPEWRAETEAKLVEGHGTKLDGEDNTVLTVRGSTDLTRHFSRNARFLLRADTVFKRQVETPMVQFHTIGDLPPYAYHYPKIASREEGSGLWEWHADPPKVPEFSPENYICHTEMEKVVKALLSEMGMPDAAFIDLQSMGRVFMCGRCEDVEDPKSWDNMAFHYLYYLKEWNKVVASRPIRETRQPIVFRNVHDLDSTTNPKPFVRILSTEEARKLATATSKPPTFGPGALVCVLCSMVKHYYTNSPDRMPIHLHDVHDIEVPINGLHYKPDTCSRTTSAQVAKWCKQWDEHHDAQLAQGRAGASSTV